MMAFSHGWVTLSIILSLAPGPFYSTLPRAAPPWRGHENEYVGATTRSLPLRIVSFCLNQDLPDFRILKMGAFHPANPSLDNPDSNNGSLTRGCPSPREKTLTPAHSQPVRPHPTIRTVQPNVPPHIVTVQTS